MKRSFKGWFSPIADANDNSENRPKKPRFKSAPINKSAVINSKELDVINKLAPKGLAELAVHPKKVKEVESWLQQHVKTRQRGAQFLLITGPPGCGKTTTVKLLCKTLQIEVIEWVNPLDNDYGSGVYSHGQMERLKDFLSSTKYLMGQGNQVVLIEDMPNFIIHDPTKLIDVLEDHCSSGFHSAVIFICTDTNNDKVNISGDVFKQEIRDKFKFAHISFNECSVTLLKNVLRQAQESFKKIDGYKSPTQNIQDAIIASAMGDIRCALNQFYFACLKGVNGIPTVSIVDKASKKKGNSKKVILKNMCRDETLGLFHSLGRVFNPKRITKGDSWRLHCDVQKLVDEFTVQPLTFSNFLFENYIKYFNDLESACKSAEMMSSSRIMLEKWCERHENIEFGLWVAVLGLMIHNENGLSKWTQITGPTKIKKRTASLEHKSVPNTDLCYYNAITKTNNYHNFVF